MSVGPKRYRCLRVHWASHDLDGDAVIGDASLEYFVAETGRMFYLRRFNGPASGDYGELQSNAELVRGDVVWRHWYDCLPDHVLVIGR